MPDYWEGVVWWTNEPICPRAAELAVQVPWIEQLKELKRQRKRKAYELHYNGKEWEFREVTEQSVKVDSSKRQVQRSSSDGQPSLSKTERRKLQEAKCCRGCGRRKEECNLVIHFIVPLEEGGWRSRDNMIVLCEECRDAVVSEGLRSRQDILDFLSQRRSETRPDWHRWVYGGERNPMLDAKPIGDDFFWRTVAKLTEGSEPK